jgi:hypothetical protein
MRTAAAHTVTRPSDSTLAGEHALLMRDVTRRAESVLALLDARAWPHAELGTLTAFLRSVVLRQVSDEEVLLFPHDATAAPFAELCAEHVRLHTLTAQLERVLADPCPPHELRALITDLLGTLHRHLLDEQAVLAALPDAPADVPSAAALAAGDRAWPAVDDGPVLIPLDTLPAEQAMRLCIERLLRLAPGQSAEIRSADGRTVSDVCRWLHTFDAARYGFVHVELGREHLLQVTRRS